MTSENSVETVEAKRRTEAEYQFVHWQFPHPFSVKDTGGWESAGCDWTRTVFLEVPEQKESLKVIFYIVFKIGSADVIKCTATFAEDQPIGISHSSHSK